MFRFSCIFKNADVLRILLFEEMHDINEGKVNNIEIKKHC